MSSPEPLSALLARISKCELCVPHLPLGPKPLLKISPQVRIVIIGQAPGRLTHERGVPWDDKSGDRLRDWLGMSRECFYTAPELGLMPMGFCFPGTGKGGDLAPRSECAEAWHQSLLERMPNLKMTVLIGKYAQKAYLPDLATASVTEVVRSWQGMFPQKLPLPHPSPRNNRWLKNNPWFEEEVLPQLKKEVSGLVAGL